MEEIKETIGTLANQKQQKRIYKWLSPADPSTNYNESLKMRHVGTGRWLLQDPQYVSWKKEPTSFLWLNGITGRGKTVLSSTVIEDLRNDQTTRIVLYFYFSFADTEKEDLDHAIRTLIDQLYHISRSDIGKYLDTCFESHNDGNIQPSLDTLCKVFQDMVRVAGEFYVVLDALDECSSRNQRREIFLE
jgi:Cdc6-like AAA superfamily ATPase